MAYCVLRTHWHLVDWPEQFHAAYPQARAFFEQKRKYDPEALFQNEFYIKYGGGGGEDHEGPQPR